MQERHIKEKDIQIFSCLPRGIRDDLREQAFLPWLIRHPFFRFWAALEPGAARKVCCLAVEEVYLLSGEEVFGYGQAVNRMLFVIDGGLKYQYAEDNTQPVFVVPGDWCCEESLWAVHAVLSGPLVATAV